MYMILMRGSRRHVVGSAVLRCVSPATISAIIHPSVGDNDACSFSPSITSVDFHQVTTAFDRIDTDIKLERRGNRTQWKSLTTIHDLAHFG